MIFLIKLFIADSFYILISMTLVSLSKSDSKCKKKCGTEKEYFFQLIFIDNFHILFRGKSNFILILLPNKSTSMRGSRKNVKCIIKIIRSVVKLTPFVGISDINFHQSIFAWRIYDEAKLGIFKVNFTPKCLLFNRCRICETTRVISTMNFLLINCE